MKNIVKPKFRIGDEVFCVSNYNKIKKVKIHERLIKIDQDQNREIISIQYYYKEVLGKYSSSAPEEYFYRTLSEAKLVVLNNAMKELNNENSTS